MKKILGTLVALVTFALSVAYWVIMTNNIQPSLNGASTHELLIPTGATYQQVLDSLTAKHIVRFPQTFEWVAKLMKYGDKIYPGRYLIPMTMSNRDLIAKLRIGQQDEVRYTINNIRTKEQLVGWTAQKLEADSTTLYKLLTDSTFLAQNKLTPNNVVAIFMNDTYQFNWNTNAEQFFDRMYKEYDKFWTNERQEKAQKVGLSPHQAIALAAIVEEETAKTDEMNQIAALYLNRLKAQMPLQADPTVKFAVGDFALRRILKEHLTIDSPYNTYKNTGLPPGPIRIPSKVAIDAVLNPAEHNYLFMCAKEDLSGYHNFAVTYEEHLINAHKYQDELDRRNIK
ncbi:MAG: endolytic transglycosylase MltG [Chitinophagales bacterium]|jgi:UPF0755 protein|nr:endolytic transglycosylase MltG [Chitinophagales bacterium]